MNKILLIFAVLLVAAAVFAENLTVKGKLYKDYEITGCSLDGIEVSHSAGIITVALEDWPQNQQDEIAKHKGQIEKLKKIQEKQTIAEKTAAAAKAKEKETMLPANAQCLIFKVIGVENGALLGSVNAVEWYKKDSTSIQEKVKSVSGFAQYNKIAKERENSYLKYPQLDPRPGKDENNLTKLAEEIDNTYKIVYVTGINTEVYTDDQQVVIAGIRSGSHKYVAVNGSTRTVPKFTAVKQ